MQMFPCDALHLTGVSQFIVHASRRTNTDSNYRNSHEGVVTGK
jgi:hypothetical protein